MPRPVVGLRDAHGLDVHHERRQHGRAAEQHRPTDRARARVRQRAAHQPLETDLVGSRAVSTTSPKSGMVIRCIW